MRAEIDVECDEPETIIRAVAPDSNPSTRFSAEMTAVKGALKLSVKSDDVGGLLTGINSCLRQVRAALDASEIVEDG